MIDFLALAWLLCWGPGGSVAVTASAGIDAELERLRGHQVRRVDGGYIIEDIAGEGAPVVGVVERRGRDLYLVAADGAAYRLVGVLARPRIAGPGYKVWALGAVRADGRGGPVLEPRRLGILAPPG